MAGNQVPGDEQAASLAGMSKNQLYDIMLQMKMLIEQNQDQARKILIQNPLLTKALFQAQIMLGMVQPPQTVPNIQSARSRHPQQATQPDQQSNRQGAQLPGQNSLRDQTIASTPVRNQQHNQTTMTLPSSSVPPLNPSMPSHPLHSVQLPRGLLNAQTSSMLLSQASQVSNVATLPLHSATQPPSVLQPMPAASTPLQQPLQTSSNPLLQLQPPLPSQPRPPSTQAFPPQSYSHMGPGAGYLHPGASQLHHSQPMFHSGSRPPTSMGPPYSQGQPSLPSQQLFQSLHQGGGSHVGMDFNQLGSSAQTERGSGWMPGLSINAAGTPLPGPSPSFRPGQMSSGSQPSRPASLTADMEKALLQQVMSLTPEQINLLPPEQRSQVLQLQQMLRQ